MRMRRGKKWLNAKTNVLESKVKLVKMRQENTRRGKQAGVRLSRCLANANITILSSNAKRMKEIQEKYEEENQLK